MSAASRRQWPHCASSTYVVMPMTGLATFEHPLPFVARHRLVEQLLFRARVVQIVVDDVVAEEPARDRAVLETLDRVTQCVREALDVGLVCVALECRPELEPLLDPVETGREQRSKCEVWIRVRSRDARLGPQRRAVADDAVAAGPVVIRPRECRRRPAS